MVVNKRQNFEIKISINENDAVADEFAGTDGSAV